MDGGDLKKSRKDMFLVMGEVTQKKTHRVGGGEQQEAGDV